jgi:hypothetical protein
VTDGKLVMYGVLESWGGRRETYGLFGGGLGGWNGHLLDLGLGGLLSRHDDCEGLDDRGRPD